MDTSQGDTDWLVRFDHEWFSIDEVISLTTHLIEDQPIEIAIASYNEPYNPLRRFTVRVQYETHVTLNRESVLYAFEMYGPTREVHNLSISTDRVNTDPVISEEDINEGYCAAAA